MRRKARPVGHRDPKVTFLWRARGLGERMNRHRRTIAEPAEGKHFGCDIGRGIALLQSVARC